MIAIRCPQCRRVIGETDGAGLYVGGGVARKIVTLECAGRPVGARVVPCNGVVVWRPQTAAIAPVCYTEHEIPA